MAATSDTTNRLTVRSPATLLTHEGGGHQLKINKASAGDTASLLFQSNWTGHAEMGLSGNTGFSIKVSLDGGSWTDALKFDPATGTATGAAVQSDATDTTPGRLMRADFGYGPANLLGSVSENSGTPTGAVIERGSNANGEFVRFADGTQICTATLSAVDCTNAEGAFFVSSAIAWDFPATFTAAPSVSGSGGATNRFIGMDTPNTTHVNCKVLSTLSDSSTLPPTVTAIGRWY
ncbi:hypothetical protein [Ruegeria sp. 6PALISEP08]|uniref:hypothetical protein n=1 Tax=Ruegeria sp. 6PALISEP08 TaxID=1225660 RepID=UPI00067E753D|nr:hypothetical protein [Ruegeria sp. 6PALISEP08]